MIAGEFDPKCQIWSATAVETYLSLFKEDQALC